MDEWLYCKMSRVIMSRFCQTCGGKQPSTYLEHIISVYFKNGFPYETILRLLKEHHNIVFSLRTLSPDWRNMNKEEQEMIII